MPPNLRKHLLWLFALGVLFVLNYAIVQKESIIKHGRTVLLRLGPVDPRSLLQGDYMRLRYALERDISSGKEIPPAKRGYLVVTIDKNHVGQFVRFHQEDQPLKPDEVLFRYHKRGYRSVRMTPDSFLFQEGHATHYSKARYGVFKSAGKTGHVLVGLANEKFEPINPSHD